MRLGLAAASALQCPAVDTWLRSYSLEELELAGIAGLLQPLPASTFCFLSHPSCWQHQELQVSSLLGEAVQGLCFPRLKQLGLEGVHVPEQHFPREK
jgi:hypothetical protein